MAASFKSGLDAIVLISRLEGCLYPLTQLMSQLDDIEGEDPALRPELNGIREQLVEVTGGLRRAVGFVHARYDVGNEAA